MTQGNNNSGNFWTSLPGIITAVTGLVVALGGGGLIYYFTAPPLGTYQATCNNISVKGGILTGTCKDIQGQPKESSLDFKQCNYGIENLNGKLECKSL